MYFTTNYHFFWHFLVLNMEGISNFVIILLHCCRFTRRSSCTRRLSGYHTSATLLLWTLQLFSSLESFFSTLGMLIFEWLWIRISNFVAICLRWLFFTLQRHWFSCDFKLKIIALFWSPGCSWYFLLYHWCFLLFAWYFLLYTTSLQWYRYLCD